MRTTMKVLAGLTLATTAMAIPTNKEDCDAEGGTWVTNGDSGFCYMELPPMKTALPDTDGGVTDGYFSCVNIHGDLADHDGRVLTSAEGQFGFWKDAQWQACERRPTTPAQDHRQDHGGGPPPDHGGIPACEGDVDFLESQMMEALPAYE